MASGLQFVSDKYLTRSAAMTEGIDATVLLARLQGMAREAGLSNPAVTPPEPVAPQTTRVGARDEATGGAEFSAMVGDAMRAVDARSDTARELAVAYERGRSDVELADVMVAAQKARVSFEALMQVRNKMVSAYRDVMNMPL